MFAALLTLLVLGGAYMSMRGALFGVAYDAEDPTYNVAYWEARIAKNGAEAAFSEFKERNRLASDTRQHLSAHVMGELIFAARGTEGIAVCDAEFGFGCYHGFFGRAISEGGEASIPELDAACVAAFGPLGSGCQHGIGHGVLEYVGYENVTKALELCEGTTRPSPLLGCPSGVFMEYNTPLVGAGDGLVPSSRAVTAETVYEPCTSVPSAFQGSCYFQLGQWLAPSLSEDLGKLGRICTNLPTNARMHCFLGAGEGVAFLSRYDVTSSRALCASFTEGEDELSCRAGVSWALFSTKAGGALVKEACAYEDDAKEARCLSLGDLTEGLDPH